MIIVLDILRRMCYAKFRKGVICFMNNIKALRLEHELSQAELAEKVGVKQTAVSKWEVGASLPDMKSSKKLAELFNVSIEYIHGLVQDERSRLVDKTKRPQEMAHDFKENSKLTGLPTEFLYQFASAALPEVYYQVVEKYRRDDDFRQLFALWSQLLPSQKPQVVEHVKELISNTDILIVEGKHNTGYLPAEKQEG